MSNLIGKICNPVGHPYLVVSSDVIFDVYSRDLLLMAKFGKILSIYYSSESIGKNQIIITNDGK